MPYKNIEDRRASDKRRHQTHYELRKKKNREHYYNNKDKYIERAKNRYNEIKNDPEKLEVFKYNQWVTYLKNKYNITITQYNSLLEKQNNKCLVCKNEFNNTTKGNKACIDHCHKTNIVRGILCSNCNAALGLLKENTSILENMINYICNFGVDMRGA